MAKKKVSGIGAIDRKIASTRKQLAAINKKAAEKKRAVKKASTLNKLQNKLKAAKKRKK